MSERETVLAALVAEYADMLVQRGPWDRPWLPKDAARASGYYGGARHALERIAARLGVSDLPERAAALLRQQKAPDAR